MPIELRLIRDEYGLEAEAVNPDYQLVAWFLGSDIQSNTRFADEVLEAIDKIKAGQETEWVTGGNAHTLRLTPEKAVIENDVLDNVPPLEVSLDDLKQAVTQWRDFITQK